MGLFCGNMNPPVPVWFIPPLSITWGSARGAEPAGDRNPHRHMWVCTPKEPTSKKTEETSKQRGARQNRAKKDWEAWGSGLAVPVTSPHCMLVSSGIKSAQKSLKSPLAPIIKTDKLFLALEKPALCYLPSDCVVPTTSLFLYLKNQGRKGGQEPAWTAQHGRDSSDSPKNQGLHNYSLNFDFNVFPNAKLYSLMSEF